ncbi:MAG: methylenetetrahydrofolate reductase [Actinomycetota bacterium]
MSFRLMFEIEPPRTPDLGRVLRQMEIFGPIVDSIIVPDNHLGRPAMSSVAIALEIKKQGFSPVPALNARDRNLLRLESDLLTLATYGIDEVLFLYGDPISDGRSSLKVRHMLEAELGGDIKRGVLATIGRPLGWRERADFLLTKLDFGRRQAGYWREVASFKQPLYCGVLALPDLVMATRILENIPDLTLPDGYLAGFDTDPEYGFQVAIKELDELRRSGVDGAQLVVPANRRRFAEMLEKWKEENGGLVE